MKCIKCDKEAEYLYVYSVPLTGLSFAATGGSFCRQCLEKVKEEEKASFQAWLEFHQKIAKR